MVFLPAGNGDSSFMSPPPGEAGRFSAPRPPSAQAKCKESRLQPTKEGGLHSSIPPATPNPPPPQSTKSFIQPPFAVTHFPFFTTVGKPKP